MDRAGMYHTGISKGAHHKGPGTAGNKSLISFRAGHGLDPPACLYFASVRVLAIHRANCELVCGGHRESMPETHQIMGGTSQLRTLSPAGMVADDIKGHG